LTRPPARETFKGADASSRNFQIQEATMALVFIAMDPETDSDHCPAVFAEEETGDLLFQGWTVTDPQRLADVARRSPIDADTKTGSRWARGSRPRPVRWRGW
jgi:hypothetical protein